MPQFWKGEARNVLRVRYRVRVNGSIEPRESDLVFVESRPFAVLEWSESGAAMVSIELDAAKLHAADPGGRMFDYAELVSDPR